MLYDWGMKHPMTIPQLIDELEWLYEKYSTEVRAATQPYLLNKVVESQVDFKYDPTAVLVRESLLEHVGTLPMIATTIYPYIEDPIVDLGQALVMLAVHDIGELVTHDVITFKKQPREDKEEQVQALTLLHTFYHDVYTDIETQKSQTAKFAKSIDKIAGDIMDYVTPASITIQRLKHFVGVEAEEIIPLIVEHKRPYMLWNPFMTSLHEEIIDRLAKKLEVELEARSTYVD